jgi:Bacterial toxin 46
LTFGALGAGLDLGGSGLRLGNLSKSFPTLAKALEGVSAPQVTSRGMSTQQGAVRLGGGQDNIHGIQDKVRREYLNEKFGRTGDVNSDINIRGRKELATNFFLRQGVHPDKVDSFLTGIDFTQVLEIQSLGAGKKLWQYQTPGAPQGNWYSITPSVSPSQLGISDVGFNRTTRTVEPKILNQYMTEEPVNVLRSTSASVEDFWSVSGQTYPAEGGAIQLFSNEKSKFIENLPKHK